MIYHEGKTPGSVLCGLVSAHGCALLVCIRVYDAKKIPVDAVGDIPNGYTSDVVLNQQARVAHQGWYGRLPTGWPSC
jgi:hypothetical protein